MSHVTPDLSEAEFTAQRLEKVESYFARCALWQGAELTARQKQDRPAWLWACFLKTSSDAYLLEAVEAESAVHAFERAGRAL